MDHCYGDVQPGCEVFNCHYKVRDVGEAQLAQERKNYNKVIWKPLQMRSTVYTVKHPETVSAFCSFLFYQHKTQI